MEKKNRKNLKPRLVSCKQTENVPARAFIRNRSNLKYTDRSTYISISNIQGVYWKPIKTLKKFFKVISNNTKAVIELKFFVWNSSRHLSSSTWCLKIYSSNIWPVKPLASNGRIKMKMGCNWWLVNCDSPVSIAVGRHIDGLTVKHHNTYYASGTSWERVVCYRPYYNCYNSHSSCTAHNILISSLSVGSYFHLSHIIFYVVHWLKS